MIKTKINNKINNFNIIKSKSKSVKEKSKNKNYNNINNKLNKYNLNKNNRIRSNFIIKDEISPSYINFKNPKYSIIDDMYYSGLIIVDYNKEQKDLIFDELINLNINYIISIFYEKENSEKLINKLTYNIGKISTEINYKNYNNSEIEIEEKTYDDTKFIRKEIQLNNEELYYLYIYINIFDKDKNELENNIKIIQGNLINKGLKVRRAFFRQEQLLKASLPFMINQYELKESAKRNILTSSLVSTYPFISANICDENGILIGKNIKNKSLIFINKYNLEKYKNSNMCIFGTSGAGKSYFTKLNILRQSLLNINQYIIDPEREYEILGNNLNGIIIKIGPTSKNYINIFDIRENSLEENGSGYLAVKIPKLIGFFNLIFGNINEEEKALLEEKLILLYKNKNINFDDNSLFNKKGKNKIFKKENEMPIMEDFYNLLGKDKNTKKYKIKLMPFVKGSLNYFNNYTNININNKLIIADIYDLGEENIKYGMYLFIDLFWDLIKENRKIKKTIYLDEIWKLIGVTSNKEVAGFVYKIFKTIRKYGGSAVAITQDINDLFSLENGTYGKSILNNSAFKVYFSLEEENLNLLNKYSNLSDEELDLIRGLSRGFCLLQIFNNHVIAEVVSDNFEKKLMEEKYGY